MTLVVSGCSSFLLVTIMMLVTQNVAGFALYLGVIALGLGGSLATLALLSRVALWKAVIPLAVGIDGAVVTSVFLFPEQTLVALPFLLVPLVLICLGRHRLSILTSAGASIVAGAFLASFVPPSLVDRVIIGNALPLVSSIGIVTLLVVIWLLSDRLLAISDQDVALADNRAAEADAARRQAEEAQRTIEQQYAEQKQLLDLVSALETPIITIGEGVLLAPVVGRLDSRRATQLTQRLLHAVHEKRAHAVIIDIAGVPLVDTTVAQLLIRTAQSIRLIGSQVTLTGITAETAVTLSQPGVRLDEMRTVRDPQEALQVVGARSGHGQRR